jgi:hypothetical protein
MSDPTDSFDIVDGKKVITIGGQVREILLTKMLLNT